MSLGLRLDRKGSAGVLALALELVGTVVKARGRHLIIVRIRIKIGIVVVSGLWAATRRGRRRVILLVQPWTCGGCQVIHPW